MAMNDSSDWEIQKNTIFQDTIFDLYTLPQLIVRRPFRNTYESMMQSNLPRKEKDGGKGWYLLAFGNFLYERQSSRKAKSQPSRMFSQKFLHYKSFLCCQLLWGPGQVIYPCYLTFSIFIMRTKTLVYVIRFL